MAMCSNDKQVYAFWLYKRPAVCITSITKQSALLRQRYIKYMILLWDKNNATIY